MVAWDKEYDSELILLFEFLFDCSFGLLIEVFVGSGHFLDFLGFSLFLLSNALGFCGSGCSDFGDAFGFDFGFGLGFVDLGSFGLFVGSFELFVFLFRVGGDAGHC